MSIGASQSPVKDQRSFFGRLLHSTPTSLRTSARSHLRPLTSFREESETAFDTVYSPYDISSSHDALVQVLRSFTNTVHQAAEVFDSVDSSLRQTHARIDNLHDRSNVISERIHHGDTRRLCMRITVSNHNE